MTIAKYDSLGRRLMPAPMMWLGVIALAGLGILCIAGGVETWFDPDASLAWRVMPILGGLSFLSLAAMHLVMNVYRRYKSLEVLIAESQGRPGIYIHGSRLATVVVAATGAVLGVSLALGAVFASGGWRVVLALGAGIFLLAALAGRTAARRTRFLWLRADGIESSTARTHVIARWDDVAAAGLPIGAGGETVLRLELKPGCQAQELWRNPWMPFQKGFDVDLSSLGVNPDLLVELVSDLVSNGRRRPLLESAPERVLRKLVDPAADWPGEARPDRGAVT